MSKALGPVSILLAPMGVRVHEYDSWAGRYTFSPNGGSESRSTTLRPVAIRLAPMGAKSP